jgi:hypothetical protein
MADKKPDENINNSPVSPKNTEKLYGSKADQKDPPADGGESIETSLPENFEGVDQEVGHTMFPSQSARDPQNPAAE